MTFEKQKLEATLKLAKDKIVHGYYHDTKTPDGTYRHVIEYDATHTVFTVMVIDDEGVKHEDAMIVRRTPGPYNTAMGDTFSVSVKDFGFDLEIDL